MPGFALAAFYACLKSTPVAMEIRLKPTNVRFPSGRALAGEHVAFRWVSEVKPEVDRRQ
jgi:hypothetical protein